MKGGRVLVVDPLHKNGFNFSVYVVFFNISVKYCFISFLYLNRCKLFVAFNLIINKAIIIYIILLLTLVMIYLLHHILIFGIHNSINDAWGFWKLKIYFIEMFNESFKKTFSLKFNVKIHCEIKVKLVFHKMLWKKNFTVYPPLYGCFYQEVHLI